MKITIEYVYMDETWGMVMFFIRAETATFKGYTEFYATPATFSGFANALLKFPFESKKPVVFTVKKSALKKTTLKMEVLLVGKRGEIKFQIYLRDDVGNSAHFCEYPLETQTLHDFAHKILATNFSAPANKLVWESSQS